MIPDMESRLQLPAQTRVVQAFPIPGGESADAGVPRARPSRSLYDILIHRRWLIVAFTATVVALVALWSYTTTPIYEAATVLQIDPERPRVVAFTGMSSEPAPQEDIRFNERVFEAYYTTQYERLRSHSLLARVGAALDLNHHPAFASKTQGGHAGLESYVDVSQVKRSRMVQITARVPDPELAAAIPNRIAKEYIDTASQEGREASEAATRWLETELVGLRRRSEEAGGTIQRFVQEHRIVPTADGRLEFVLRQLDDQNRAYTEAESERIRNEAKYRLLATADPDTVAAAVGNDLLRTLKADLSRLEREVARAHTVYGSQHPKMLELEAELTNAKARLENEVTKARDAVEREHLAATRRANELGRRVDSQRDLAIQQYARQTQLQLLRKEAEATDTVYSDLIKRLKELELSAQLRVANIKVIDVAERPRKPVRPNHQRDLMLALAGGLLGGLALAFVLELGDTTLRSAREADLITQLPSVGTVPAIRGYTRRMLAPLDDLPVRALPRETRLWPERIAGEAFRSIRATVLKRGASTAPRTLLVTSAQPSEGKSFVAVNLAAALAKTGHPVLLIDGDFHQPVCHRAFGLELPSVGLSTLLARGDAPCSAIVPSGVSNLSFLPTGPRPADPAALLSSERLSDLLNNLREQYRWVVIDSPPVLPASDAAVLAPVVDGVLLVARAHATPVEAVWVARDRLELSGAKILGLVLNHVRLTRNRYFYANYG